MCGGFTCFGVGTLFLLPLGYEKVKAQIRFDEIGVKNQIMKKKNAGCV